jgi:ankyrin repeat protein
LQDIELLVLARADIFATDTINGQSAVHLAAANGHAEIIPTLLRLGARVDTSHNAGLLPLEIATACGDLEEVNLLQGL